MRVIGTAGHVDHGKSTLVKRLTGIDPDRLSEEKAREMTIDLGFAWLQLPNGESLGIVDVPGHRDFIANMLAGVGGIDAVLLVIAADEGVMPQTREHLAILDLLGISGGLIVLSKIDLVDDPDWIDLVEQDVRSLTVGTVLENASIVRVSARTGAGLSELLDQLRSLVESLPLHKTARQPRLPIDRIFTVSGFGTVVTGTLIGGALHTGDEIEIQPAGLQARIRGLHSYNQPVETAEPGSRVAVNLTGIDKGQIERGFVVARPGLLQPTMLIDVHFRYLPDVGRPLKHDAEVKIFVGAAEAVARVRLLAEEMLLPGMEGWLQLQLSKPLALAQGDRFILRYPSPSQTIGGGVVVNSHPPKKWRRFQQNVIQELETRMLGTPAQRVAQYADLTEPIKRSALYDLTGMSDSEFEAAVQEALASGLLVEFVDSSLLAVSRWREINRFIHHELTAFHSTEPLKLGMPREALRSRLGIKQSAFNVFLEQIDDVVVESTIVRLTEHAIRFTGEQEQAIDLLMGQINHAPFTPPSTTEAAEIVGEPLLRALVDLGIIVQVQPDVIFSKQAYDEMVNVALMMIDRDGGITASVLRDYFNTTRKFAIGLLEYLDSIGITKRTGDIRVRGPSAR